MTISGRTQYAIVGVPYDYLVCNATELLNA